MIIDTNVRIRTSLVSIAVPESVEKRLATTCFRDMKCLAGNFSVWKNAAELFADKRVMGNLLADVGEAFNACRWNNSVCIELDSAIGWAGTDKLEKYHPEDLEEFKPNMRSTALRVKLDRLHLPAPKTDLLTIIYKVQREVNGPITVTVWSIYPGVDIGELRDNITLREQCVFFDWNHPGQA